MSSGCPADVMSYPVVRHHRAPLPSVSHRLSFPFKFTAFKTQQPQTFLPVFSDHLYIHTYGRAVPQADSHACWTYVYADGYICIADSSPLPPSTLHRSSSPVSVIDTRIALIPSGITAAVLPPGQNHSSHCQNSWQCLCVLCAVFRVICQIARPCCCPFGESRAWRCSCSAAGAL